MFETVVTSSVLIAAVLIVRKAFKGKISSRLMYALWLPAALRLLLPFSLLQSPVSIMNFIDETLSPNVNQTQLAETVGTADAADFAAYGNISLADGEMTIAETSTDNSVNFALPEETEAKPPVRSNEKISFKETLKTVRLSVTVIMFIWFAGVNIAFYIKLRRDRKPLEYDFPLKIFTVSSLSSPCIFGLVKPSVYVTNSAAAEEKSLEIVAAHEYCHYFHGDMVWAVLRCVLLGIYWFNPLVWAAAFVSQQDGECACDEAAIERLGEECRCDYGQTLLSCVSRKGAAFGVASTSISSAGQSLKERLTLIAKKPKNAAAAIICSLLALAVAAGCTFTSAEIDEKAAAAENESFVLFFETEDNVFNEDGSVKLIVYGRGIPEDGGYKAECSIANPSENTVNAQITGVFDYSNGSEYVFSGRETTQSAAIPSCGAVTFAYEAGNTGGKNALLHGKVTVKLTDPVTGFDSEYTYTATEDSNYYYSNTADWALTEFIRTYDNYSEYYSRGAKEIYIDNMSVIPDENGRFAAYSNLWIEYGANNHSTVPLRFSRDTESWLKTGSERKSSYANISGILLENRPFEDKVNDSWNNYLTQHYPYAEDMGEIMGEPVIDIYIRPVDFGENKVFPQAGFVYVSENYHQSVTLVYEPVSDRNTYRAFEEWVTPRGTGAPPFENDSDFYEYLKSCQKALPDESMLTHMKYRAGDVIYSFEKSVPAESGYNKYRIDFVMTEERYPDGMPADDHAVRGSFALRVCDSSGSIISEQPLVTEYTDSLGTLEINTRKSWLEQYFRYSRETDNLIVFSTHAGYSSNHFYSAVFYGITGEGELFPYHIDSGEFPDSIYRGENSVYIGNLLRTSPRQISVDFGSLPVSYDLNCCINRYSDYGNNEILSVMYFDSVTHTVKNVRTLEGKRNDEVFAAAQKAMYVKYNVVSSNIDIPLESKEAVETIYTPNGTITYCRVDRDIAEDKEGLIRYITDAVISYPIGAYNSEEDMRRGLFEETMPFYDFDSRQIYPYYKMIDGKLCCACGYSGSGAAGTYTDNAVTLNFYDDYYAVIFLTAHTDYYELEGYTVEKCPDGKWRARDDIKIH